MKYFLLLIVIGILFYVFVYRFRPAGDVACTRCYYIGPARRKKPGSIGIEIVLWFFIIPGLIYSIWRSSSTYKACESCGSGDVVPLDSPKGQEIVNRSRLTAEAGV